MEFDNVGIVLTTDAMPIAPCAARGRRILGWQSRTGRRFVPKNRSVIGHISFSYDEFHRGYISLEAVKAIIDTARDSRITTDVVRDFFADSVQPGDILNEFGDYACKTRFEYQPVFRTGSCNRMAVYLAGITGNAIFILLTVISMLGFAKCDYLVISTLLIDLVPIMRGDGYYILMTLMKKRGREASRKTAFWRDFVRGTAMRSILIGTSLLRDTSSFLGISTAEPPLTVENGPEQNLD